MAGPTPDSDGAPRSGRRRPVPPGRDGAPAPESGRRPGSDYRPSDAQLAEARRREAQRRREESERREAERRREDLDRREAARRQAARQEEFRRRSEEPPGERRRRPVPPPAARPPEVTPAQPTPVAAEPSGPASPAHLPRADPAGDEDAGGPPTEAVERLQATGPTPLIAPVRTEADPPRRRPPPPPSPLRYRVLPRSIFGIASMILAFAVGAALSGTILYAYYQYHLDQNNQRVNALIHGYKQQFTKAEGDLQAAASKAEATIQQQLNASSKSGSDPKVQQQLVSKLASSLYFVQTQTTNGAPSVGTGFVVSSTATQSFLLTSYTTIKAATVQPAPTVYVSHGRTGAKMAVTLETWDPTNDLALIILPQGNLPAIKLAPANPAPELAQPVFALSGDGAAGASISSGEIDDVSTSGLVVSVPLGPQFQGAPIVNSSGQAIAVGSLSYSPQGFGSTEISFAPYVDAACTKVLRCPGGKLPGT